MTSGTLSPLQIHLARLDQLRSLLYAAEKVMLTFAASGKAAGIEEPDLSECIQVLERVLPEASLAALEMVGQAEHRRKAIEAERAARMAADAKKPRTKISWKKGDKWVSVIVPESEAEARIAEVCDQVKGAVRIDVLPPTA